jgi:hypothetical protein
MLSYSKKQIQFKNSTIHKIKSNKSVSENIMELNSNPVGDVNALHDQTTC